MVNFFRTSFKSIVLTCMILFSGSIVALDANAPQCRIDGSGNVIAVWSAIDGNGNAIIQGATKPFGNSWSTPYDISYDVGVDIINNPPVLYSNSNVDVVIAWEYYDTTLNNWYLAASILPAGTTTWNTAVLSTDDESANYGDQRLSINNNGNIIAMWTSTVDDQPQVRASTFDLGTSTTWTIPISITGG